MNLLAISLATIAQFIVGAIWYTPLFGQQWGKIHGFDKLDAKTQKAMTSQMMPLLGAQFIITILTSIILTLLHTNFPSYSLITLTILIWIGFVAPAQASSVLFGGTPAKWIITKIAILAGGSIVTLITGAFVINYFA